MILALHIGNTQTLFGVFQNGKLLGKQLSVFTEIKETAFGYAARIRQVLELVGVDFSSLEGSVLSCVVPSLLPVAREALLILTGKEPICVGAGIKTGLRMNIDDPGTVGADLVCMAVAAKEKYPLPCVVIDFETAITLTCLDQNGSYIGGAFLPGVKMSLSSLAKETSLLPDIELIEPKRAISTSTVECMRSGILFGTAGAIDGLLSRMETELKEPIRSVVFTGALGATVCPYCRHSGQYDPMLLLNGLFMIYQKNQK